jgi:hypothetical protein
MGLPLDQYDHQVGHHLRMIRHHASAIETHVHYMTHQPGFESIAEENLMKVQDVLVEALEQTRKAISVFRSKPHDT